MHNFKLAASAMLLSLSASAANAVECHDGRVTQAIERATGRTPKLGECNLAIYRVPPGHLEFDLAVKEALAVLEKKPVNGRLTTQKLGRLPEIANTERK